MQQSFCCSSSPDLNLLLASYERREGRRLNSPLLLADAYLTTSDIWITGIVLVGLTGA